MKQLEMEYRPFIYTTIIYLMLCIKFRKELVISSLRLELYTFARDFLSYRSLKAAFNPFL